MSKVAVCIASYNSSRYLAELLEDLTEQTFTDFTTYIVYDGSTDDTKEVINDFKGRLKIVTGRYGKTARVGLNKNKVVKLALKDNPEYIQMIDADDRVLPAFLEAGLCGLESSGKDWAITWGTLFGGREGYIRSELADYYDLIRNNKKQHSWGIFKAKLLKEYNFDPKLDKGVDWALWLNLAKAGYEGKIVKVEFYRKRWHDKSVTKTIPENQVELRNKVLESCKLGKHIGKFRFHLLGLVHLPTSEHYSACAFTQKNVKLAKMLLDLGHEVWLYGAEGSDCPCTKFIQTHTLKDIRDAWGEGDNRFEIGYDWKGTQFKHDINAETQPVTRKYYENCIREINKHKNDDDFILLTQGSYQRSISQAVGLHMTCEPGIGYRGSFCNFRSFESTYIQNFTYGSEHPRKAINGRYYDRVIPNYFDTKDFPFQEEKDDYFLFMGRLIIRKGLDTAIKAVEAVGGKLLIAGQKDEETKRINIDRPSCEYVGYADAKKRADLMRNAKAVFCPSIYLEPFCGVHVEAMLCGTPVITTNFGAFTDTIINGVNGYRCDTLQDFVDAAKNIDKLDPKVIRDHAERFTLDSVKLEYQKWFSDIYNVWESSNDNTKKGWHRLT